MHDSHIHIALNPLKENILSDIQEFIEKGGKKILAQSTDIADYIDTIILIEEINALYPEVVDLALGIHPTVYGECLEKNSVKDIDLYRYAKKQIAYFNEIFEKNKNKVKAIGEVGLDYFEMNTYLDIGEKQREELKEIQRMAFKMHTKLSLKYNLPLSIHSRDIQGSTESTHDILSILAQEGKGLARGVFHSYTGDIESVEDILNMGMYIGFNAIITYPSGANVRKILEEVPLNRILFETDGPFLPTQSVRKKKKEEKKYGRPVLIEEIIRVAADIKGISYKKLEDITDTNYTNLFGK